MERNEKDKSSSKVFRFDRYEKDREKEKFGSLIVKQVATEGWEKNQILQRFFFLPLTHLLYYTLPAETTWPLICIG